MERQELVRLIGVRDDFASVYRRPAGRFVSLGFSFDHGEPRLNVLVNNHFDTADLPQTFHGIKVQVRPSEAGILAVGEAPLTARRSGGEGGCLHTD